MNIIAIKLGKKSRSLIFNKCKVRLLLSFTRRFGIDNFSTGGFYNM